MPLKWAGSRIEPAPYRGEHRPEGANRGWVSTEALRASGTGCVMTMMRMEARNGFRYGVVSLAAIVAVLTITSDAADARHHRRLRVHYVSAHHATRAHHHEKNARSRSLRAFPSYVRSEGLEPPTYKFVACCSIQLSYDRALRRSLFQRRPRGIRRFANDPCRARRVADSAESMRWRRGRDSNPRYDVTRITV